jgi:hypothetical protein
MPDIGYAGAKETRSTIHPCALIATPNALERAMIHRAKASSLRKSALKALQITCANHALGSAQLAPSYQLSAMAKVARTRGALYARTSV